MQGLWMPAPPRAAMWDGGARSLPLDGHPSPRPAIPGGVLSSRARVRFAGQVDDRRHLSQDQVVVDGAEAGEDRPLGQIAVARHAAVPIVVAVASWTLPPSGHYPNRQGGLSTSV